MAWLAWLWVPILDASGWGYLRTSQHSKRLQTSWTGSSHLFTQFQNVSDVWGILVLYFWAKDFWWSFDSKNCPRGRQWYSCRSLRIRCMTAAWWCLMIIFDGNPEMCSSWGSWGLISRGSQQRQSRSHSNELPRRDLQGCWDQLGMGHFTLSCNIL